MKASPPVSEIKLSLVIPAASEEDWLAGAIESVRAASGKETEVIVVVNGATDDTAAIARELADQVIEHPEMLGYSRARNQGARVARGQVLAFLDADSRVSPRALRETLARVGPDIFGTVLGRPDVRSLRYLGFFFFKNLWHRLRLYHGVLGGYMFCDATLYRSIAGFDETKDVDEIYDFSRRARAAGGRHLLLTRAWAMTSMRRFERQGLVRSFVFWLRLRFPALFGRVSDDSQREYV